MPNLKEFLKTLIRKIYLSETQILKDLKEGDQFDLGRIWREDSIADIQKLDELLLTLLAILKKEKIPLNRLTLEELLRHLRQLTGNGNSLLQRGSRAQVGGISKLGPKLWVSNYKNEIEHLNSVLSEILKGGEGLEDRQSSQLMRVLNLIKKDERIYAIILQILSARNPDKFKTPKEAQRYFESPTNDRDALGVARLIDSTLGPGTFRTLSFLDTQQDASKSIYRLLAHIINSTSFEKQVEKGYYLNLLENYGVQWDLEKVARDTLQNFFDANGQTLDRIKLEIRHETRNYANGPIKVVAIYIVSIQDYDWRELIHFGATTKQGSETAVGGFGEGLKIAAFVLLRDHGALQIRASSRNWVLDYYFAPVNPEAYRKPINGLHAKKYNRAAVSGNSLEILFSGEVAEKKAEVFSGARELFYSSENPDFQDASYDEKSSGGFKILPPNLKEKSSHRQRKKGRLYLAGQRTHFDNRSEWNTVHDLNIWTWKKVQPKDRDRGMITDDEMKGLVLPIIVDSMPESNLKKSVYDFKELWDKISSYEVSYYLLEKIVDKLAKKSIILNFESKYLSSDILFCPDWIRQGLIDQGFVICVGFLKKIGMEGASQQFLDWQNHSRVEATRSENRKIAILQTISKKLGLPEEELKEVWIFTAEGEKNIFHGQYNPKFYWMAREILQKPLLDALHTYVHEAAHKEGPHGNAKFEYGLQERIKLIHQFTIEHRKEWAAFEKEWGIA